MFGVGLHMESDLRPTALMSKGGQRTANLFAFFGRVSGHLQPLVRLLPLAQPILHPSHTPVRVVPYQSRKSAFSMMTSHPVTPACLATEMEKDTQESGKIMSESAYPQSVFPKILLPPRSLYVMTRNLTFFKARDL